MTEQEAVDMLKECENAEPEVGHYDADQILLQFIRELGYVGVAEAWEKITPKWYA